jgi:hypothetical protein
MNKMLTVFAIVSLTAVTACSGFQRILNPPPPPVVATDGDQTGNAVCGVYRTLAWAIPLVHDRLLSGRLDAVAQAALDDAILVASAGCQADNASWQARANAAAQALVSILWDIGVPPTPRIARW